MQEFQFICQANGPAKVIASHKSAGGDQKVLPAASAQLFSDQAQKRFPAGEQRKRRERNNLTGGIKFASIIYTESVFVRDERVGGGG
jgi:hypothetical protein